MDTLFKIRMMSMARSKEKRTEFPFAIVLAVVGALLLFGNFDILQLGAIFDILKNFWPLIVIAMGVGRIISGGSERFSEGLIMITVGLVLQVAVLGLLSGNLFHYWPAALILIGLWLIFVQPKSTVMRRHISDDEIRVSETVRGSVLTLDSPSFRGGRFRAMCSAVECDLSRCLPGEQTMKLRCGIRVSRISFCVPEHWRVTTALQQSFASVEDRRALGNPPDHTDAPELYLEGIVKLASLEIRDVGEENTSGEENA
jgi:hypothetical protein